jgi:hypothetical protein
MVRNAQFLIGRITGAGKRSALHRENGSPAFSAILIHFYRYFIPKGIVDTPRHSNTYELI